ncbi:MAG: hypothetical protein V4612_02960 [Pseudomonadota bacterium]
MPGLNDDQKARVRIFFQRANQWVEDRTDERLPLDIIRLCTDSCDETSQGTSHISKVILAYNLVLEFYQDAEPELREKMVNTMRFLTNCIIDHHKEEREFAARELQKNGMQKILDKDFHAELLTEILLMDEEKGMIYAINFPNSILELEDGLDDEALKKKIEELKDPESDLFETITVLLLSREDQDQIDFELVKQNYDLLIDRAAEFYKNNQIAKKASEFVKPKTETQEKTQTQEKSDQDWSQYLSELSKGFLETLTDSNAVLNFMYGDYLSPEIQGDKKERLAILFAINNKDFASDIGAIYPIADEVQTLLKSDLEKLGAVLSTFDQTTDQGSDQSWAKTDIDEFIIKTFSMPKQALEKYSTSLTNSAAQTIKFWLTILKNTHQLEKLGIDVSSLKNAHSLISTLEPALAKLKEILSPPVAVYDLTGGASTMGITTNEKALSWLRKDFTDFSDPSSKRSRIEQDHLSIEAIEKMFIKVSAVEEMTFYLSDKQLLIKVFESVIAQGLNLEDYIRKIDTYLIEKLVNGVLNSITPDKYQILKAIADVFKDSDQKEQQWFKDLQEQHLEASRLEDLGNKIKSQIIVGDYLSQDDIEKMFRRTSTVEGMIADYRSHEVRVFESVIAQGLILEDYIKQVRPDLMARFAHKVLVSFTEYKYLILKTIEDVFKDSDQNKQQWFLKLQEINLEHSTLEDLGDKIKSAELEPQDLEFIKKIDRTKFFVFLTQFSDNYQNRDFEQKNYGDLLEIVCSKTLTHPADFISIVKFFDLEGAEGRAANFETQLQEFFTKSKGAILGTPEGSLEIKHSAFKIIYGAFAKESLLSRYQILETLAEKRPSSQSKTGYNEFSKSLAGELQKLLSGQPFDDESKKTMVRQFFPNLSEIIFTPQTEAEQGLRPSSVQQFSSGDMVVDKTSYSKEEQQFLISLGVEKEKIPLSQSVGVDFIR